MSKLCSLIKLLNPLQSLSLEKFLQSGCQGILNARSATKQLFCSKLGATMACSEKAKCVLTSTMQEDKFSAL
jgi:hypothetical protein